MPRPRFTLRVLFVAMTLLCVWIAYSFALIRQRHEALAESGVVVLDEDATEIAPWLLYLFGEPGYRYIGVVFDSPQHVEQFTRLKLLFPEAEVGSVYIESSPRQVSQPWPWTGPEVEDPQTLWGQTLRPQINP
jgi:hypothetical protein